MEMYLQFKNLYTDNMAKTINNSLAYFEKDNISEENIDINKFISFYFAF